MKALYYLPIICLSLSVALFSTGCAALQGAPDQTPSPEKQRSPIVKRIDIDATILAYDNAEHQKDDGVMMQIRNDYIRETLFLYNSNYQEWINDTAFQQNTWDTITKIAVLGVDAAGTLTGGAESKAILAAISGGITGSTTLVDKNYFYSKTMPALVSAMNAAREKDLIPINKGLALTPEEYSLHSAMDDLNTYFYDGTFLGALDNIQKTSGQSAQSSHDTNTVLQATFSTRMATSVIHAKLNDLLLKNSPNAQDRAQIHDYQQQLKNLK